MYCQIGANAGVVGMTKEHLGLALALGVPVFVVVTKIDMCPPNILQESLQVLHKILKSPGCRKIPVLVQSIDDVIVSATNFTSERFCLNSCNIYLHWLGHIYTHSHTLWGNIIVTACRRVIQTLGRRFVVCKVVDMLSTGYCLPRHIECGEQWYFYTPPRGGGG